MNRLLSLSLLMICFLFSSTIQGQNDFECSTPEYESPPSSFGSSDCSSEPHFVPDQSSNFQNTPILVVNINFHFFRPMDGSGLYANISEAEVQAGLNEVNWWFSNIQLPELAVNPPAEFIPDSRIRFQLKGVYTHDDDIFIDFNMPSRCSSYLRDEYGVNIDTELNVFYYTTTNWGIGGCGPQSFVNMSNASFGGAQLLRHELGHAFGVLPHTFSGCGDDPFPDTYHPDPNLAWLCGADVEHSYCGGGIGVSNNVMGYNSCTVYFSPLQLARMHHRSITSTTKRKFLTCETHGFATNIEITDNAIWHTSKVVDGNITVKQGVNLEIKCTVFLKSTSKIIVEPGGTLIVDGGVLTNYCGQPWRGIEVHGNTSQHQYAHSGGQYHQGRAIFKNGAVIENAWQGVMNWNPADWGSRGGIIQATNSTFRNNRIDAIFMAYQNFSPSNSTFNRPEQSFFRECNFELNDDYLDDPNQLPPRPRITMWRTDRLRIQGCNFTNTQTVDASEKRSHAIYSHDANYLVTEYCASLTYPCPEQNNVANRFTGWHKAIEALETESSRPITVRNSVFNQNMIGVELGGADYSQIYKNDFNLGVHPFSTFPDAVVADENHLGIFANETYHFSIEENTLTRPSQGAPYDGHGILVFNSQGANNVVYKNNLSNLKKGINGWQVNRNTSTEGGAQPYYAGLQYICNQNQQNVVDFEISRTGIEGDFGWNDNGIRLGQGSSNPPRAAANTFSGGNPDPLVFTHFTINSYGIYGYFHFGSGGPTTNEIGPGDMGIIPINTTNNCPSNYTTGILTGLTGKTQLLQKKAEYEGMLYAYNQLIDDGNTPAAVTEVELTWPQNAWDLRDQLMQRAPYNSETVLIAAIDRNIMPHAMLLEVLLANPDALRSGHVIRRAETVPSPPMPQYMIDLLWAARNQSTFRTAMESTMAELFADLERSQKIILTQKAFADSTYSAPDSTLYYLSKVKTVEGNYSRAAALAERHMYTQAIALVDSMQLHYRLSNQRLAEMNALKNLYTLMAGAHSAGLTIANLDSERVQGLRQIAENPTAGIAAKKAQNALCFHYQICYNAQGQPKSNAAPRKPQATYEELVAKLNTVTAYPNPSDQYVTIAYTLMHAKEQTTLQVFDATGRQVESRTLGKVYEGQQLFDTRKMPNGMYLFQIVQEGKKVSDGKFVVTH